jgi:hypothetical protein
MQVEEITIKVDSTLAKAYRAATEQERRRWDLLLGLRLQDVMRSQGSLQELMRDLSRKAQERGLTAEELKAILDE